MADYVNYDNVLDARDHGATGDAAYEVASMLTLGRELEKENARDAYYKVNTVFKNEGESPHKYFQLKTFPIRNDCLDIPGKIWSIIKTSLNNPKKYPSKTKR